ncbi:MAG: hypothetical protein VX212_01635 [Pseudomonadota bacterium]|nr:hypothetical protein [Pseudomonadota bacterium]
MSSLLLPVVARFTTLYDYVGKRGAALDNSINVVIEFAVGEDLLQSSYILDATGGDSLDALIPGIVVEI